MVTHTKGEVREDGTPIGLELEHEDHPKAPVGLGEVDLRTVGQVCLIVAVLGYAAQLLDRDALPLVVSSSRLGRFAPRRSRASEISSQASGSKCARAPGLSFDAGLRLVIGGKHVRFVLAPERL